MESLFFSLGYNTFWDSRWAPKPQLCLWFRILWLELTLRDSCFACSPRACSQGLISISAGLLGTRCVSVNPEFKCFVMHRFSPSCTVEFSCNSFIKKSLPLLCDHFPVAKWITHLFPSGDAGRVSELEFVKHFTRMMWKLCCYQCLLVSFLNLSYSLGSFTKLLF